MDRDWFSELQTVADQPAQSPERDWFSEINQPAPAKQATPPVQKGEPDAATWAGRRVQDVRGRQDPNFSGVESVSDDLYAAESNSLYSPQMGRLRAATVLGPDDAQYHDVLKSELGPRYIGTTKDANDYDVIQYYGEDGVVKNGYVNKPGLDMEDVSRSVSAAVPYVAGAMTGIGSGLGWLGSTVAGAVAGGAGSVASDVALAPLGSEQGIKPDKAAFMAFGGGLAPTVAAGVGSLWRRFVTVPGLFDRTAGKLTERGAEAARRAGLEPDVMEQSIAENFAQSYARTGDVQAGTVQAMRGDPTEIPATMGQITKRPDQLTMEEQMRRNLYGEKARETMEAFDRRQSQAIKSVALGGSSKRGIGEQISPGRVPGVIPDDTKPSALGNSVREGVTTARDAARTAENEAWAGVRNLTATPEALKELPAAINRNLDDVVVDDAITPMAARMGKELESFIAGEAPGSSAGIITNRATNSVDQMRRRLGKIAGSAQTPEDRRAASAVYNAYNDWIGEAAEKSLLAGEADAAMKLASARGFTREVRELFEPRTVDGVASPAAQRIAKVLDGARADSGETVIDSLLGTISSGSASGTIGAVQALGNIKAILARFGGEGGKRAWDDIRLAYWTRLNMAKTGEMYGPQAIETNLKTAFQKQDTLLRTLYSPEEMKLMRQYFGQVSRVAYKPPNASGSGYVTAGAMKEMGLNILSAFGLRGRIAGTALEYSKLPEKYGASLAKRAVEPQFKTRDPNLNPLGIEGLRQYHDSE